jgi:uncharacterized protein (TIGR02569 family)
MGDLRDGKERDGIALNHRQNGRMVEDLRPPEAVLRAFRADGHPVRLAGGKGGTWQVGGIVMKPAEGDDEVRWRSELLASLPETPDFRIARPVRAADGDWIASGWEASRLVAGVPDQQRAGEIITAAVAFHAALAGVPRPSFLDNRRGAWANGEWLAWNDLPGDGGRLPDWVQRRPSVLLDELLAVREAVGLPEQIVHGDLIGNVLFADGLPPAVIDWAAYWRPPGWAYAVAVVDAMVWHGFDLGLARRYADQPSWGQLLVRAAIFRLATWDAGDRPAEPEEAYQTVVRDVVALVNGA